MGSLMTQRPPSALCVSMMSLSLFFKKWCAVIKCEKLESGVSGGRERVVVSVIE